MRLFALRPAVRWAILAGAVLIALGITVTLKPMPQPTWYHNFADGRSILGVPNALNVLSNLPFAFVGLIGLYITFHNGTQSQQQRWTLIALFVGLFLTGFGSGYYHLAPDNQRLVWDRLPMTVAMAGFISALLVDRFGSRMLWLLPVILMVGAGSVLQWNSSEQAGHGGLRWYALYQALAMILGVALLVLFPATQIGTREFVIAIIGNVAAKLFELLDKPIYHLGGVVSGHTLKHLSAGLAFIPLVVLLARRASPESVNQPLRNSPE